MSFRPTVVCLALSFLSSSSYAGNTSNYLPLINGIDFFLGGTFNPSNPTGTHGILRCIPSEVLHAPTRVIDPNWSGFTQGTYAAKVTSLHFAAVASTGTTANWPTIAISSSDGDCRFAPGGALNYGFASSSPLLGTTGLGWFAIGPLNGSTPGQANLLAILGNVSSTGPFSVGPTGATIVAVDLSLSAAMVGPSAITVPAGDSALLWMAENPVQGPGAYQYWTASFDEGSLCSSLSALASAIGPGQGSTFSMSRSFEFGLYLGTLDSTLMTAIPAASGSTGAPIMGTTNPIDVGTGGLTISLTGSGGTPSLSFNSYDGAEANGGAQRIVLANLMALNALGAPNCGDWSPGYTALPTGGPGGPTLSSAIPQQPRIVGRIDTLTNQLMLHRAWIVSTRHSILPGGNQIPLMGGIAAPAGGSTGNNGGAPIPIPNLPALVGVQLYFSGVSLNATGTAVTRIKNDGHSHSNGYPTTFFP